MRQFEMVEENAEQPAKVTELRPSLGERTLNAAATHALLIGLKALSQRALVAVADLFTLITVGLVFWLWASTPNPDQYQIISLTIFALFVLAANWIVRGRR